MKNILCSQFIGLFRFQGAAEEDQLAALQDLARGWKVPRVVCMYVCCVCYVCMYVCMCILMICIFMYVCVCVCIFMHVCVCVCVCICVYLRVYYYGRQFFVSPKSCHASGGPMCGRCERCGSGGDGRGHRQAAAVAHQPGQGDM